MDKLNDFLVKNEYLNFENLLFNNYKIYNKECDLVNNNITKKCNKIWNDSLKLINETNIRFETRYYFENNVPRILKLKLLNKVFNTVILKMKYLNKKINFYEELEEELNMIYSSLSDHGIRIIVFYVLLHKKKLNCKSKWKK
tara:strand:- start:22 stop:447 length:426 start_codon:yes stop_codon:yes gene_type:complete